MSDPAAWSLFSCRIPLSLSAFSLLHCEMRRRCSVCFSNQTLTACQGKACWVKRLTGVQDLKETIKMRFMHMFPFLLGSQLMSRIVFELHINNI